MAKKNLLIWFFVVVAMALVANNIYFATRIWSWSSQHEDILGTLIEDYKKPKKVFKKTPHSGILDRPLKLPTKGDETPNIVLLRAIGNALPPRHDPQQAVINLNFTLINEPDYPNVYKHWVLNRLVDPTIEAQLIELLEGHGTKYSRIPFNLEEYAKIPYNFDFWEEPDVIHTLPYHTGGLTDKEMGFIDECITNDKNLYATNQNGARNVMLDIGINEYKDADWILPWDGNCFVHPNGIESLFLQLHNATKFAPEQKYFYTPMSRATSNEEVLDHSYQPETKEEPQLVFHRSAKARFHPLLRYGRRNKVELIQRLKIAGPWDRWKPYLQWEEDKLGPFFLPVEDLWGPAPPAGFVTRLSSGRTDLEASGVIVTRGKIRTESLLNLLSGLDVRAAKELHHYNQDTLLFYNEMALKRDRELYRKRDRLSRIRLVTNFLINLAKSSLSFGPWSVTDKPEGSVAPSNDPHDYYHPAPYFWPATFENGTIDETTPYVRRDGQRVPGTELFDSLSGRFDRTRLMAMTYNTTVLALTYYIKQDEEHGDEDDYANVAAWNIRHWFLNPDTRMNPNMKYAQIARGHNGNTGTQYGLIEMKDLHFLLDAVRILEKGGYLTDKEMASLRDWFREYLEYLENSEQGLKEYTSKNNHGTYYDVQYVAVAAFVGDTKKMLRCLDRSVSRLLLQVKPDGSMPHEMKRPICEHYQMFTLSGWATLARMGQAVGRELWKAYPDENGDSALCRAARFSIPFFSDRGICKEESPTENVERWWPLLLDAQHHCPSLRGEATHWPAWFPEDAKHPPSTAYRMPSVYYAHDGISPFWNLGLPHAIPGEELELTA